jgi:hypothetical protein
VRPFSSTSTFHSSGAPERRGPTLIPSLSLHTTQDVLATTGVLLFSYPKANTLGCTTQANGHNDQAAAYKAKGFAVYGISADKPATQANWRTKYNLTDNLLCDPTFAVLKQLDCPAHTHPLVGRAAGTRCRTLTPARSRPSPPNPRAGPGPPPPPGSSRTPGPRTGRAPL